MGPTYDGVAACGNAYPNNWQGNITYNGVELDSYGFQCYELAARYFCNLTGLKPPVGPYASDLAWLIHDHYPQYPVTPGGLTGTADTYSSSLTDGAIVSMWSSSDVCGHIGVVIDVALNSTNSGRIWVIDENASGSALDTITVNRGVMNFEGLYTQFQWVYGLPNTFSPPIPRS